MNVAVKSLWLILLCLACFAGCEERPLSVRTDSTDKQASPRAEAKTDWPIFRGDPALRGVALGELAGPTQLLWTFKTGGPVNSSAVVLDGRVFFGSGDSNVYAVDLIKGDKVWSFPAGDVVEAPPLALNGRVYVGTASGVFHALDAKDGKPLWSYSTGDKILASANWAVVDGKTNLFIGSYDYFLHCIDAVTGRSNWVYETGNYINGAPAVADGRVVFGGCDAVLHLVSTMDGQKRGEIPAGAYVAASVALDDGKAYYGHYENEFQCVDLNTAKKAWTFRERNFPYFSSAAITADRVLFGGRDKRLHCVSRTAGTPLWQFSTRGKVDSSPVVCGDKVVVGSDDGRLYVVSLKDGSELWSYEIGQPIGTTPAVAQGRVVVGSEDGNVYCFGQK